MPEFEASSKNRGGSRGTDNCCSLLSRLRTSEEYMLILSARKLSDKKKKKLNQNDYPSHVILI